MRKINTSNIIKVLYNKFLRRPEEAPLSLGDKHHGYDNSQQH